MAATIHIPGIHLPVFDSPKAEAFKEALAEAWQRFEARQQQKAERMVLQTLMKLDNEHLAACGYSASQIEAIRAGIFVRLP